MLSTNWLQECRPSLSIAAQIIRLYINKIKTHEPVLSFPFGDNKMRLLFNIFEMSEISGSVVCRLNFFEEWRCFFVGAFGLRKSSFSFGIGTNFSGLVK